MDKCRCAIWTCEDGWPGTAVAELLGRVVDIELLPVSRARPLPPSAAVEVAVCVARSGSLQAALESVAEVRTAFPGCPVLAAGYRLNVAELTALMAGGVSDFVSIPVTEDEVAVRVHRAAGHILSDRRSSATQEEVPCLRDFIGKSPVFLRQIARLRTIARCNASVLILGETGTGKEVCAQAVHYLSARASKPCIALNCGAIPLDLIESELFGHVRGAYTTAHTSRSGLAREAEGGTLFLDDVDCLPLAAQAKLLRFLQEREYRPVGSSTVHRADVRVVAATNRRLADMSARGQFRQDLFFRLNVLSVDLPPLRERLDDIPLLARYFIRRFSVEYERPVLGLTDSALSRLLAYDWPGNVRELKNTLERAVVLAPGATIDAPDIELADSPRDSPDKESFRAAKQRVVASFERGFVERLLVAHGGNVTQAAFAARKNRRAFFQLMRKHRIEAACYRAQHPELPTS